jgi:glycine cleavage system H protein
MMTLSTRLRIIPPDENGCVWMTAGVLKYQLCDRELNCDECPLDAALRRKTRAPAHRVGTSQASSSQAFEPALRKSCLYSRNHCWVLHVAPRLVRVGIEPGLARLIGRIRAILLPSRGQTIQPGQTCAWIVTAGGTLPLETPVGGSVQAANPLLAESPHLLQQDPFNHGWLYEAAEEADSPELDLVSPERIATTYAEDHQEFLTALNGMFSNDDPDPGCSLAGVEARLESIIDFVGPKRYFNTVRQIYT